MVNNLSQRNTKKSFENCAPLGYYAASSGNFLPTFRGKLSVPSSRVKNPTPWFVIFLESSV